MTEPQATALGTAPDPMDFAEYLETCPPGSDRTVSKAAWFDVTQVKTVLLLPELHLHCVSEHCNGKRFWSSTDRSEVVHADRATYHFVRYQCRNCQKNSKIYALLALLISNSTDCRLIKIGEFPAFGPPTPSRLISMIGPDRELFLRGRRCENQGLGVGAFAYYRRVVENQKTRILDEVIRVSEQLGAGQAVLDDLRTARNEVQFTKAVKAIRHGLPDSLIVKGQNPFTLLHAALSEGLHSHDDEVCLDLARSIRVVLAELSERIGAALKDDEELVAAVTRLTGRRTPADSTTE